MTARGTPRPADVSRLSIAPAGVSVVVVAVLAFVVVAALVAVGGLLVLRFWVHDEPKVDVAVTSTITPTDAGVRVHTEVVAVQGSLPETVRIPTEEVQGYLSSQLSDIRINARSAVRGVTVDGRAVEPGDEVAVTGRRLVLDYELAAQDVGGRRVAYSLVGLSEVRPVTVDVTVEGVPVTCEVPMGFRPANSTDVWTRACTGSPVHVERAVPDEPGFSRQATPAWVRVDYGP